MKLKKLEVVAQPFWHPTTSILCYLCVPILGSTKLLPSDGQWRLFYFFFFFVSQLSNFAITISCFKYSWCNVRESVFHCKWPGQEINESSGNCLQWPHHQVLLTPAYSFGETIITVWTKILPYIHALIFLFVCLFHTAIIILSFNYHHYNMCTLVF